MEINVNSNHSIERHESLTRLAESVVETTLGHLSDRITHVEVHLSDENGNKGGGHDKRCVMEARIRGHQPLAVTEDAATVGQAIDGAAGKLKSSLDHTFGRLNAHEARKHENGKDSHIKPGELDD